MLSLVSSGNIWSFAKTVVKNVAQTFLKFLQYSYTKAHNIIKLHEQADVDVLQYNDVLHTSGVKIR